MEINFIDVKTNGLKPQNQLQVHVQYGTWKGVEQAQIVTVEERRRVYALLHK